MPLGRSLQRYAAAPDYFAAPRIVVAVTGDAAAGPGAPRLADRLFLGYAPAAEVIEAISYDEAAGRFVFEEVVGYGAAGATIEPAERRVCLRCHQGEGPIFARPLWSETNANPAIAARLAPLGASFHGAPVAQTVDGLAAFDAATDRAAPGRRGAAGCGPRGAASRRAARRCSSAAVRVALGGAPMAPGPQPAEFERRAAGLWPDGLGAASPDLPNRDPLLQDDPADLETEGALDPETPRDPLVLWRPEDGFGGAARLVAEQFTRGRPRLDRRPRRRERAGRDRHARLRGRGGAVPLRRPRRGGRRAGRCRAASRGCGGSRSTACRRSAGSPGTGCRTAASRA